MATATTPPDPEPVPVGLRGGRPEPGVLTTERARIAVELGDIVAHSVAALSVCAGAAERQLRGDTSSAGDSLRAVRVLADQAVADLRRLQALLHDGPPGYAPQPGLGELEALAAAARARGLDVEVAIVGDASAVPPSVAVSIHRIVESALLEIQPGGPAARIDVEAGSCALVLRMSPPLVEPFQDARDRVRLHGGRLEQDGPRGLTVTVPL